MMNFKHTGYLGWLTLLLIASPAFISQSASAEVCGAAAFNTVMPREAEWRRNQTQSTQSSSIVATSPAREAVLKRESDAMADFVLNFRGKYGVGDIPPMEFYAAEGTRLNMVSESTGENGTITRYRVRGIGTAGVLKGTFLLPVSGHNGNAKARAWSKTDTYSLLTKLNLNRRGSTDQTKFMGDNVSPTDLIRDIKSLDLITFQEIEIQLDTKAPVVILYDRSGSAGPGGYVEGRVMEFEWDDT